MARVDKTESYVRQVRLLEDETSLGESEIDGAKEPILAARIKAETLLRDVLHACRLQRGKLAGACDAPVAGHLRGSARLGTEVHRAEGIAMEPQFPALRPCAVAGGHLLWRRVHGLSCSQDCAEVLRGSAGLVHELNAVAPTDRCWSQQVTRECRHKPDKKTSPHIVCYMVPDSRWSQSGWIDTHTHSPRAVSRTCVRRFTVYPQGAEQQRGHGTPMH